MGETIYLAAAIAVCVSIIFGIASHVQQIALDHMDVRSGTIVNIATTTAITWLLAPVYLVPENLATQSAALFALSGLIVPAVSISFATLSVRTIGPGLTAGLASTAPVFAMIVAVLWLGEVVTAQILAGTLILVMGIVLIALRSQRGGANWPLWALALPLVAALTRGVSHPIIKLGLVGLPSPMTAALISSTVSLVVLYAIHLAAGRTFPAWNRGYYWFALCGVINGVGIIGLNLALQLGEVIVVSPLIAATPAFTLLTGYLIFRREVIGWSTVGAISLIFCGCVLIIVR